MSNRPSKCHEGVVRKKFATSTPPPNIHRKNVAQNVCRSRTSGVVPHGATSKEGEVSSAPTSFAIPKRKDMPISIASEGVWDSGSDCHLEHGQVSLGVTEVLAAPCRQRGRNLSPSEVRNAEAAGAMADRNDLEDDGAIWRMFLNPVYGDPTCPEEEYSDLPIRFAHRGLRWARLASAHGIAMAHRRMRTESRPYYGYGVKKPDNAPQLFAHQDEFDLAKNKYLDELTKIIHAIEVANCRNAKFRFGFSR